MAKNGIRDLRDHLFEVIEMLKDDEKPMDIERAKAICQVSEQIIESAKIEVKRSEVLDELTDSGFFDGVPRARLPRLPGKPNGKFAA